MIFWRGSESVRIDLFNRSWLNQQGVLSVASGRFQNGSIEISIGALFIIGMFQLAVRPGRYLCLY